MLKTLQNFEVFKIYVTDSIRHVSIAYHHNDADDDYEENHFIQFQKGVKERMSLFNLNVPNEIT